MEKINLEIEELVIKNHSESNMQTSENSIEIDTNQINLNRDKQIFYKLSMFTNEEKDYEIYSKDFEEMVKQIVESKNETFLQGEVNLIEYLISQYSNKDILDVKNVESLTLRVKENFCMLNEFGRYLPKLSELNLSGSLIKSISDVGTNFVNLVTLNVSNCSLYDLTGIMCFQNLENLDCSYNHISDLLDLEMCFNLQNLNLKNNQIEEEDNLSLIANLPKLKYLNLTNNPIQRKNKRINKLIQQYFSHIEKIDLEDTQESFCEEICN